jgi:hypothetical protein
MTEVNFGSCAHYIGVDGEAHCPLIKGLPPIRAWRDGLDHFDQTDLKINTNNAHCPKRNGDFTPKLTGQLAGLQQHRSGAKF